MKIDDLLDVSPALRSQSDIDWCEKAETHMRMLVTKIFQRMRRKIDDHQPSARAQHACGLADRDVRLVEKVQHLMDRHQIEILRLEAAGSGCRHGGPKPW
jgi:hypothetical protein